MISCGKCGRACWEPEEFNCVSCGTTVLPSQGPVMEKYVPPHLKHCDTETIPGAAFTQRPPYPSERPLTYLASPYSHPDPLERHRRFESAAKAAAWLIENRKWNVFAPIVHSHPLATVGGLKGDWDFWKKLDTEYIDCSCRLVVLELPGWRDSVGVTAEVALAKERGLEIVYMDWSGEAYAFSSVPMTGDIEPLFDSRGNSTVAELYPHEVTHCVAPIVKPTSKAEGVNPKDVIGATKVSLSKLPAVALAHGAHAMMDGARKYDAYNWRAKSVRASIYVDAAMRHIWDWFEGEEDAQDSKVHHLGHALACCAILLDCQENGRLVDDRPQGNGVMTRVLARLAEKVKQMPPLEKK